MSAFVDDAAIPLYDLDAFGAVLDSDLQMANIVEAPHKDGKDVTGDNCIGHRHGKKQTIQAIPSAPNQ